MPGLFSRLCASTLACLVLAVASMAADHWRVASWLVVAMVVSLLGLIVVRSAELAAQVRQESRR